MITEAQKQLINELLDKWKALACDKAKSNEVPIEVWEKPLEVWKAWKDSGGYAFSTGESLTKWTIGMKACREMSAKGYTNADGDSFYCDIHTECLNLMNQIDAMVTDKKDEKTTEKKTTAKKAEKETTMAEGKSAFDSLKQNAKTAAIRSASKKLTGTVAEFLAKKIASTSGLKGKEQNQYAKYVEMFLKSDLGKMFVGMLLKQLIPKAAGLIGKGGNATLQEIAEECEITGMQGVSDQLVELMSTGASMIKDLLGEALATTDAVATASSAEAEKTA